MGLKGDDLEAFLAALSKQGANNLPEPASKKRKHQHLNLSDREAEEMKAFELSNLNRLEHCAHILQKAVTTIIEEAPDLLMLQRVIKNENIDQLTRQDIEENPLLHMVCELKSQYLEGNLKDFDRIVKKRYANTQETGLIIRQDEGRTLTALLETTNHHDEFGNQSAKESTVKSQSYTSKAQMLETPPLPPLSDKALYKRVFSHKSMSAHKTYLAEEELVLLNYERLEFLGDAVLNYVTTLILYDRFPFAKEGFMSRWRSSLVCNKILAEFSTRYNFDSMIRSRISHDALNMGRQKVYADIFEAYVGALAKDRKYGLSDIKDWLTELMAPSLAMAEVELRQNTPINKEAKTQLYSLIGSALMHPAYRVTASSSTFNGVFSVQCVMGDEVLGKGSASNLKEAGLRAAMDALKKKHLIDKYVKLRLETDRSKSVIKDTSSEISEKAGERIALFGPKFPLVADKSVIGNKFAKNEVYAYFSQNMGVNPEYNSTYDNEEKRYVCELRVKDIVFAIACDVSKKNAESRAAALILQNKHLLPDMMNSLI